MNSVLLSRVCSTYARTLLSTQCRAISVSCCRNQQATKVKSPAAGESKGKKSPKSEEQDPSSSPAPSSASQSAGAVAKEGGEKLVYQQKSSTPFSPPAVDGEPGNYSPKILHLMDEIANLTLLEVADLNKALKKKLNLPDAPMYAPSMAAPAAKAEEDESAPAVAAAKTKFSVKLTKIDDSKKIATIKEIKSLLPNLNLVQAKKFVEVLPQVVKGDLLKDEAEKIVAQLTALGAVCEID